jgi:hypothetical protein
MIFHYGRNHIHNHMTRAQNVKSWHCCDGQEHYSFKIVLLALETGAKQMGVRIHEKKIKSMKLRCTDARYLLNQTIYDFKLYNVDIFVSIWRSYDRASSIYSFKYNQQDATLCNILYSCQCSTRFRLFLRPSLGAQNCTHSIWYMSSFMLRVQFWSPNDGRRNSLKHVEHWQ